MGTSSVTPALPPGFTLEDATPPPLPPGFSLESQAPAPQAPPPDVGARMTQGAIPRELRGFTPAELAAPGQFTNPRTGQRSTLAGDLVPAPVLDTPARGLGEIGDGAAQMTRPDQGEQLRGAAHVALGAVDVATPAMAALGITAPLDAAAWYAMSKGTEGIATDLSGKAGLNPADAQLAGRVAGAAPLLYGFGRVAEGSFADAIDAHNARAEDLVAQDAAHGRGVDLGESITGPQIPLEGTAGLKVVPMGASPKGRPNYSVVDPTGKAVFGGNGREVQNWLAANGVERTPAVAPEPAPIVEQAEAPAPPPGFSVEAAPETPAEPAPAPKPRRTRIGKPSDYPQVGALSNGPPSPLTADASAVGAALTPPAEMPTAPATPAPAAESAPPVQQTVEGSAQTSDNKLPGQKGESSEVSNDTKPVPELPAGFHEEPASLPPSAAGGRQPASSPESTPWYRDPAQEMDWFKGIDQGKAAATWQQVGEAYDQSSERGNRQMFKDFVSDWAERTGPAGNLRREFDAGRLSKTETPAPPAGFHAEEPEAVSPEGVPYSQRNEPRAPVEAKPIEAAATESPETAPGAPKVTRLNDDFGNFSVPNGSKLLSASGRALAASPKFDASTNRKRNLSLSRQRAWLVSEAQKEAEAKGDKPMARLFASVQPNNYSRSDADTVNDYLFGDTDGPSEQSFAPAAAPKAKTPKPTTPPATSATPAETPTIEAADADGRERPHTPRASDPEALAAVPTDLDSSAGEVGRTPADGGGSGQEHGRASDPTDEQAGREPSLQPGVGTGEGRVGVSSGRETPGDLTRESSSRDYRITDDDETGQGTTREKLERNLAAVRIVKTLAAENRPATPAEQHQLAKFVGWGGLKDVFDKYAGRNFAGAREELTSLLTPEEYAAAEKSTYNAHYTSPLVVRGMWDAVKHMGVTPNASILEPAMGVGNFFGMQPDELLPARRTGVELDSISGAIAKALYPDSNVQVTGFERLALPHNFFDVAISNVPFGNVPVYDAKYPKLVTAAIHNYFFVKGLDLVRPGGIVAFVTSSFTMDALKWSPLRERLAAQANLLGAIRLPNTAFKANAGTEVTTDIIFLQKRAPETEASGERWIDRDEVRSSKDEPIRVNEYYAAHPDMMLGKMELTGSMHHGGGSEPTLEGKLTPELLAAAIAKLPANVYHAWSAQEDHREGISAFDLGDQVKDGGYAVKDGVLAQREGAIYRPLNVSKAVGDRIKAMIGLRDAVREVRRTQIDEAPDKEIKAARKALEKLYDAFVKAHGFVNTRPNASAFQQDPDFQNIQALENYDSEEGTATKTDIFTERTIQQAKSATHADRADEALAISLNDLGRIDWDRMQQLTGKTPEELREEMRGQVYRNPETRKWETQDEYLSGNVRAKLEAAEAAAQVDGSYEPNVDALKKVQPADLPQSEIRVNLGAAWIPADTVAAFVRETFDISNPEVRYSPTVATWTVNVKDKWQKERAANASVWGTKSHYGHELLDMALNSRTPNVYQTNADGSRSIDPVATATAIAMQDAIRNRFTEWVWEAAERGKDLAARYNREFNGLRGREFDGSHLTLPGSNPAIKMRPHQLNAIWRAIQTGNTLLAHEVGAGKTYEMVAIAMESRRLGLARKPMLVVPNHMLEQFGGEFKQLYANAKLLVISRDQLGAGKRALALARIANGNWDAVIVAHSSFARVGVSDKTFNDYMAKQTAILRKALEELEAEGDGGKKPSRTFKEIQKALERLKVKIEKRAKRENKDKGLSFEELGVDMLLVDEAHAYKKLPIVTKRTRVAGLPQGESQRAMDMHMKTEYVSAPSGGKRGVIFATGTPVTNTLAEMYNMQRFLQPATLRAMGIEHFDAWANTFARAERSVELDITGGEYRENTRFSRFVNMPELARVFRMVADVKTAADLKLPTPEVESGATQPIVAEATDAMRAFVKDLMARAKKIRGGGVDPKDDNMLKIASAGKKAALDMRLVDPNAEDAPGSKVNLAVASILNIWKDTEADSLTQMVFCDLSTPKSAKAKKKAVAPAANADDDTSEEADSYEPEAEKADEEGAGEKAGFSVYDDMKAKLIAGGIPSDQIAFIHDYDKDAEKKRLFSAVNKGKVRVIFGSTEKMGVGTNVQRKLIALHEMDTPWRPADITQREGRIKRQGNLNPIIKVYQYLTEGSLDSFSWQTITAKAGMVGQAMNGNLNLREVEDIGLSIPTAAEFMGMASGDPIIREQIGVNAELARLQAQRAGHARQVQDTKSAITQIPGRIQNAERTIAEIRADVATAEKHKTAGFTISKTTFTGEEARQEAAAALHDTLMKLSGPRTAVQIGSYRGLELWTRPGFTPDAYPNLTIKGEYTTHANTSAEDPMSAIASVEAVVRNLAGRVVGWSKDLDEDTRKLAGLEKIKDKQFPFEGRFKELVQRKAEIDAKLAATAAELASTSADSETDEDTADASASVKPKPAAAKRKPGSGSVTLGSGFGALQPYFEKFLDETVKPTAKQVAEVTALAKDDILKVLAPGARAGAKAAHLIVRKNAAELARSTDRAETALRVAGKYFAKQTPAENHAFIDAMESGTPQADPALDGVAKLLRTMLDTRREAVQKLGKGKLDNFIEDYFPHIWQQPDQARTKILNVSKKNLDGAKSFLKKRTIETLADGLALGLIPVSDNPVDLVLLKTREMDKYLMGHHILADLKGAGQLQFKRSTAEMPEGYKLINDRAATVYGTPSHAGALQIEGHWVAPEPAARVVNNLLSPGLRDKSILFRGALGASNMLNQAQLGFSAFHLAFTTMDVATSKLALGIYQLGKGDVLKGLKAIALTPVSPLLNILRGDKMLKEWYAPGTQGALLGELVDAAVQAGGRARQDGFYETEVTKNMLNAFRAGKVFAGAARIPFAIIEQSARPIMEYIVPRQKMGVFADLAQYELEKLGTHASDPDVQAALARAWDSVDNRLGQLVYDNLAWNKVVKDLAMVSVRSVGWNVGTISEVGGGAVDLAKLVGTGGKGGITPKMSYLIALNIMAGLIGFSMYYLWHGHAPHHLKDYYFPTDSHGHRWSLPSYVKDEHAWATDPVRTIQGKVNPLLSTLWEALNNKDFFDKPIRKPHAPAVKQAEELALFMAKQFIPLGLRPSEKKGHTVTPQERAMRFVGITPAPKSLDQIGK